MATYKVAQDVEADDKLLGPFGFRQFIYLIIVAMAGFIAYGLWQILPPLAIIPSPIIIFFGALALPLRKDQPMETYLAAMVSFYLKPRKRLWSPDGVENIVEIIAPKTAEDNLTKNFNGNEADRRLSYLADLADSRGWAIRHAAGPTAGTSMLGDVYIEAQTAEDVLEEHGNLAQNIDSLIGRADAARRQELIESMRRPQPAPQPQQPITQVSPVAYATPAAYAQPFQAPSPQAYTPVLEPAPQPPQAPYIPQQPVQQYPTQAGPAPAPDIDTSNLQFNPYPSIHQSVIQPLVAPAPAPAPAGTVPANPTATQPAEPVVQAPVQPEPLPAPKTEESTSDTSVTPDIMNLANNSQNLSVETIAREADRLKGDSDEVVISLR